MSDPTKVYGGGVPLGGFDTEMRNAGFGISGEAESNYVPGGPAKRPGTVNEGGPSQGKTYSKSASEDFLGDSSYQPFNMASNNWTGISQDVDNPDDLSHADSNDDPDLPKK